MRRRMSSKKLAIIGVRSSMPKRGTTGRIGARIGSVISWTIRYRGFSWSMVIHEKTTRRMTAMRSTSVRIRTKRKSA